MSDDRTLRAPEALRAQQQHELIAFVAEAAGRLHFAEQRAKSVVVDQAIVRDLRQLAARLEALHLVVTVECGWCPKCGAPLTDPERSPSRTRHCQRCCVGWQLARQDGRITADALPWPHSPKQASGRYVPAPGATRDDRT